MHEARHLPQKARYYVRMKVPTNPETIVEARKNREHDLGGRNLKHHIEQDNAAVWKSQVGVPVWESVLAGPVVGRQPRPSRRALVARLRAERSKAALLWGGWVGWA